MLANNKVFYNAVINKDKTKRLPKLFDYLDRMYIR